MIDEKRLASAIHYPECWDVTAYPTVETALHELLLWQDCNECGKFFNPLMKTIEECDCCFGTGMLPETGGDESPCINCNGTGFYKYDPPPTEKSSVTYKIRFWEPYTDVPLLFLAVALNIASYIFSNVKDLPLGGDVQELLSGASTGVLILWTLIIIRRFYRLVRWVMS